MLTSLKKHIDAYNGDYLTAAATAYYAALASVGRYAEQAVPGVEHHIAANLLQLQQQLLADPAAATAVRTQHSVDSELGQWAESVEKHLKAKAVDAREIMLAMAAFGSALAERDRRYVSQFQHLTSRLEHIADLDDVSEMRRSLLAGTTELKANVKSLESEGQKTIANLESKLEDYRKKIAEVERRERLDPLTGLVNRRGIEATLAARHDSALPFSVVLIDLNSFKPVNDTYGHSAGDDVLKQFSAELKVQFRTSDLVGRWGGDEFIAIVSGEMSDANDCIERVRKWAFGAYKILTPAGLRSVDVTAAVGVASWNGSEATADLVARADAAMYLEKRRR